MIRIFSIIDYEEVYQLWGNTSGVGLRAMDASKEGIKRFLKRNPTTNYVAIDDGHIIGAVLGGHAGRRGYIYHACVQESYRRQSIGRELIERIRLGAA